MTDGMGVFEGDCFLLRWNMGICSANRSLNTQILGSSKLFSLWSLRSLRFYLWFRALRSHLKQNGYALADFTFSDRGDRVGKAAGTGGGLQWGDEFDGDGGGDARAAETAEGEAHFVAVVGDFFYYAYLSDGVAARDAGGAPFLYGGKGGLSCGEVVGDGVGAHFAKEHEGEHLAVGDGCGEGGSGMRVDVGVGSEVAFELLRHVLCAVDEE